jgi:internalin A
VVIGYLHRAGELYYYENQFNNQIILDQEWALKAVYAVLKHERIKRYQGIFQLDDLIEIWKRETPSLTREEAQVFLDFMLSNQIMFYTTKYHNDDETAEFVIPQLLPDQVPPGLKKHKGRKGNLIHQIHYAFLHRDIIERFIVRTSQFSKDKAYWKNGVYIEYEGTGAIVEVLEDKQKKNQFIQIECFDGNTEALLRKIRAAFDDIRSLEKASEIRMLDNQAIPFDKSSISEDKTDSGFKLPTPTYTIPKKKVFISYSHQDEYWKNELLKHLTPSGNQELLSEWNDRQIEAGEWDPQIEQAMEEADLFLLLITANFLASPYITSREITTAYERYKAGKS